MGSTGGPSNCIPPVHAAGRRRRRRTLSSGPFCLNQMPQTTQTTTKRTTTTKKTTTTTKTSTTTTTTTTTTTIPKGLILTQLFLSLSSIIQILLKTARAHLRMNIYYNIQHGCSKF